LCSGIQTRRGLSLCAPGFKPDAACHFVLWDSNLTRPLPLCSGIQTRRALSLCAPGFKPEAALTLCSGIETGGGPRTLCFGVCCAVTPSTPETARVCVVFCRRQTGGHENKEHLKGRYLKYAVCLFHAAACWPASKVHKFQ
jgi:hypothetical protein